MLRGSMEELDKDGNVKEDGIKVERTIVSPKYLKDEVEKANPLKDDGFFAVTLRDALQAIDYTQVARAIIGDLDSMGKSD